MPKEVREYLEKAKQIVPKSKTFVGVDVGSSSTKVVQLSIKDHIVTVDTYGMISNATYADAEEGQSVFPETDKASGEVSDLMHEIAALSRRGAIAIPFSETLMQAVELPKRDSEQMQRIIPVESQKYIPVPVSEILLDWYVIPDEETNAFDATKPLSPTETHMQKVMLVGVNIKVATKFTSIASRSGLSTEFCEIEVFSALRASLHAKKVPTLVIDLGASSTKVYVVDQHWVSHAARLIPTGGQAITQEIRNNTQMDFPTAERLKKENGLATGSPAYAAIEAALAPIWNYIKQLLEEEEKAMHKKVEQILIMGGGSYMPGLLEHTRGKLLLPVERLQGFARTSGPMILEDTFKEDGPLYAVAVGLALRGLGM